MILVTKSKSETIIKTIIFQKYLVHVYVGGEVTFGGGGLKRNLVFHLAETLFIVEISIFCNDFILGTFLKQKPCRR